VIVRRSVFVEPREFEKQYSIENRHFWFVARRRLVRRALEHAIAAENRGALRILEISCATGRNLIEFRDLGRTLGIDLSEEALAFCRRQGAQVVRANAEALPLCDQTFDVVLALDALEHFDHDDVALAEAFRVLRPGGIAVLTVPACPSLWSRHDEAFHHRRRYRRGELWRLVESAGLGVERMTHYSSFLLPPLFVFRWLRRMLPATEGQAPRSDFHLELPAPLVVLLDWVYRLESILVRRVDLPFGASLLAVARRSS
jgi:SAM-dependent methyltransferase